MAASKSDINVKIDADVKILATQILEHMGIDQTTAIDMFFRQIIAERGLPFQPALAKSYEVISSCLESMDGEDAANICGYFPN